MISAKVYNHAGAVVREEALSPKVFGVTPDTNLLHFVVTASQANHRRSIANTKTRAEVRGGGKKPWKQKHTGRARHGSTRSPIWVGGGITFGPRSERNYTQKINAKVMQKAMRMSLSSKAQDGKILLVESWALPTMKTKQIKALLSLLHIPVTKKHAALLIAHNKASTLVQAARNISSLRTVGKENVNVVDLLLYPYVVATPEAIQHLTKTYERA